MATQEQIAANRRNAQCSIGPRTPEGRAASSRNAAVTGMLSRRLVHTGVEDPAEFQALLDVQPPRRVIHSPAAGGFLHLPNEPTDWRLR
ncbi:MAG: hypothetical protein IPM24_00700 [Bryobacterales bacterium]|nr:hypothetical protein [Bryobacterales bacterium]